MRFRIKVCQANLKRDVRSFADMSPFVQIEGGHIKRKTSIHAGGGKKPKWNENITIDLKEFVNLEFTVYDEGTFGTEPIGRGWLELQEFVKTYEKAEQTLDIFYDAKVVGKLLVHITNLSEAPQSLIEDEMEIQQEDAIQNMRQMIASKILQSSSKSSQSKTQEQRNRMSSTKESVDVLTQEIDKFQKTKNSPALSSSKKRYPEEQNLNYSQKIHQQHSDLYSSPHQYFQNPLQLISPQPAGYSMPVQQQGPNFFQNPQNIPPPYNQHHGYQPHSHPHPHPQSYPHQQYPMHPAQTQMHPNQQQFFINNSQKSQKSRDDLIKKMLLQKEYGGFFSQLGF